MRTELEALRDTLRLHDPQMADLADRALGGSEGGLRDFLISNELWGGAGSIADQSGIPREGGRPPERVEIEAALIRLGEAQLAAGIVNPRTQMWVDGFRDGLRRSI